MNHLEVKLDQKESDWLFIKIDRFLVAKGVGCVPSWLQTDHLTLLTLIWSPIAVISGWLSSQNPFWLGLFSFSVLCQYITDMLDGAVGRHRNTGLITWGYYMDHFLDYVFMCSVLIGYGFIVQGVDKIWLLGLWVVLSGFMIHTFLFFSATKIFKISYCRLGPTELRYLSIGLNTFAGVLGMAVFHYILPLLTLFAVFLLIFTVFKAQYIFYQCDLKNKNNNNK